MARIIAAADQAVMSRRFIMAMPATRKIAQ
jgi:hypothetical protein